MYAMRHQCGPGFRLRFEPLFEGERAVEIPCSAAGEVDLDALVEADRNAYFYARTARRLHFAPRVVPADRT